MKLNFLIYLFTAILVSSCVSRNLIRDSRFLSFEESHNIDMTKSDAETDFDFFFTQELDGKSEDCGCPKKPRGGVKRRLNFFKSVKGFPNKIFFDAGRSMFPWNEELVSANAKMGYHAYNVGIKDLDSLILSPEKSKRLNFVSANIYVKNTKVRLQKFIDLENNSKFSQIRVTGLASASPRQYFNLVKDKAQLLNPRESLLKIIPSKGILIVLSDLTEDDLMETFQGIEFAVPVLVLGINSNHVMNRHLLLSKSVLFVAGPKYLQEFGHLKLRSSIAGKFSFKFETIDMGEVWN